ncbi:MAG: hypothetical protein VX730_00375 [Pseudomonadota bacterium]|nr:hypothetical protein [Pseudomonadota bacterium]
MSQDLIKNMLIGEDGHMSAANSDLYHVTTGQSLMSMRDYVNTGNMYLRGGMTTPYTIMAGARWILPALSEFRFDREFIDWAKSLNRPDGKPKYDPDYLDTLAGMPFNCQVDMMPDGTVTFPGPIGRVTGDPVQAKWVDTIISDFLRRCSSVATKAARLTWAVDGKVILADNSMRRSNDTGGFMTADIAYMCGMLGTSNMNAAMRGGYTAVGTMDHWFVKTKMAEYFILNPQANPEDPRQNSMAQQHAFRKFMKEHPDYGALLIDTISVEQGLLDAIVVLKEFNPTNYQLRIDSGDLARGAIWCMKQLQKAGINTDTTTAVTISLSGGLRAVNLASMVRDHSVPFTTAGIGGYFQFGGELGGDMQETKVNTTIVTKSGYLKAPNGAELRQVKLSENPAKASLPGILDRVRLYREDGKILADVAVDMTRGNYVENGVLKDDLFSQRLDSERGKLFEAGIQASQPIQRMLNGPEIVDESLFDLSACRARFEEEFAKLPESYKPVNGSHTSSPVGIEREMFLEWKKMITGNQIVSRI